MITSLIGGLMGLLTTLAPSLLKEMQDTRNHQRELEHLKLQNQMQIDRAKIEADGKLREAEAAYDVAHMQALTTLVQEQFKPTGIKWIDGFNAVIRPATSVMLLILFAWTAYIFISGVIAAYDAGRITDEAKLAQVIWGSMIGEAFQAVFGYLFVAREARKRIDGS